MYINVKVFFGLLFSNVILVALFQINKEYNTLHLSNTFFYTSIFFLSVTGLSYVRNKGVFDGPMYSFKRLFIILFRPKQLKESASTLYEYKINKKTHKDVYGVFNSMLILGVINFIIALILAINYGA